MTLVVSKRTQFYWILQKYAWKRLAREPWRVHGILLKSTQNSIAKVIYWCLGVIKEWVKPEANISRQLTVYALYFKADGWPPFIKYSKINSFNQMQKSTISSNNRLARCWYAIVIIWVVLILVSKKRLMQLILIFLGTYNTCSSCEYNCNENQCSHYCDSYHLCDTESTTYRKESKRESC